MCGGTVASKAEKCSSHSESTIAGNQVAELPLATPHSFPQELHSIKSQWTLNYQIRSHCPWGKYKGRSCDHSIFINQSIHNLVYVCFSLFYFYFYYFFKYIYWLCYYSSPIPPPSLHSILPTPPSHTPPYSSCPWVILISSLASTFPMLFLPSTCLFSTYHLCYLFSVPFPPLSHSHFPVDDPPCDLHFCGSVPVLVVCVVCFCFGFRCGC